MNETSNISSVERGGAIDGARDQGGIPDVDAGGLTFAGMSAWLGGMGLPPWRTGQVFRWIHARLSGGFHEMSDLPAALRSSLSESAHIWRPEPVLSAVSDDGASKFVFPLRDGLAIESVLLPGPGRVTACVSSQVGCPVGCAFCKTGGTGFMRNLSAGEIAGQFNALRRLSQDRVTNVVYMGMGEPLLNVGAVLDSLSIITDPRGAGIGTRHITVSTVGVPEGIAKLASHPGQTGLAISLHSAVQATRERLVPVARQWSLREVRKAATGYSNAKNRPVTFEFCLLDGINDSPEEARALGDFTRGIRCKINLIPCNEVAGTGFSRPPDRRVRAFLDILAGMGRETTVRKSLGSTAGGACGQLGASLADLAPRG